MNELPPPLPPPPLPELPPLLPIMQPAKWSWNKLTANQKISLCVIGGVAALFVCTLFIAMVVVGIGTSEIASHEKNVKHTIETNEPGITIIKVILIKESDNYYTGLAECQDGRQLQVEVKGSPWKNIVSWREMYKRRR
jgi:hypothetical protein